VAHVPGISLVRNTQESAFFSKSRITMKKDSVDISVLIFWRTEEVEVEPLNKL
jgi:hypothetical protein